MSLAFPSNNLAHLLQAIEGRETGRARNTTEETSTRAEKTVIDLAQRSVCFNMGDVGPFCEMTGIPELVRSPYPTVWVEYEASPVKVGVMWNTVEGGAEFVVFNRYRGTWIYSCSGGVSLPETRGQIYDGDNELRFHVGPVFKFFSALNCSNVKAEEHKPPEKLQRARAKKGKRPLFSTWTLRLTLGREEQMGSQQGGTHSSPRLHLRRGHAREYKPGKYCWVQPHVVGNKKLGMVHKDYAL